MSPRPNWHAIADRLAGRLTNHAGCPENHQPPDPDCPFCDDLDALDTWRKASTR